MLREREYPIIKTTQLMEQILKIVEPMNILDGYSWEPLNANQLVTRMLLITNRSIQAERSGFGLWKNHMRIDSNSAIYASFHLKHEQNLEVACTVANNYE